MGMSTTPVAQSNSSLVTLTLATILATVVAGIIIIYLQVMQVVPVPVPVPATATPEIPPERPHGCITPRAALAFISFAGPESRTFPETGKTIVGPFLRYFNSRGGLALNGFPISDAIIEVSDIDGVERVVQYFERNLLEYHPENPPGYQVQGAHLGSLRLKKLHGDLQVSAPGQNERFFNETNHSIGEEFYESWKLLGGIDSLGYPVSEPFYERSELDGKNYYVQYFQRAILEIHPENPAPNDVLSAHLGLFRYQEKYCSE